MTVFGYMRVSTNETRQSFRSQKDALRKAGATKGAARIAAAAMEAPQ